MNVRELIEILSEQEDQEREVLVVHQVSWPLQEVVAGVYDPEEAAPVRLEIAEECSACGEAAPAVWAVSDEDGDHRLCDNCFEPEKEAAPLYLVANGHPYGASPYGPREAWSAV